MDFLINLFDYLFSNKKTLVYTTHSQRQYYKIVAKLKAASVKYRVATTSNLSAHGSSYSDMGTEYKFYVKEEDESLAQHAIHNAR